MLEPLLQQFRSGDRRALSKLLTIVARGQQIGAVSAAVDASSADATGQAPVVAITGSGGVGKSSLVGRLIELLRKRGQSVAVLACDPQSSLTGGALLGDRIRMAGLASDDGVFIRSLAVPSGQQAIACNLALMLRLLKAFGFDAILLETVGAGQGDVAVRDIADVLVLLVQPEAGDELQWEKAGLLELADVVVVNKGDLAGAERVEAELRQLLNLSGCRPVAVLRASAATGDGVAQLWDAVTRCAGRQS